mgnify:CR=1 FL=1
MKPTRLFAFPRLVPLNAVFFSGLSWSADSGTVAMRSTGSHVVNVLLALAIVTVAIIALAWVVKRLGNTSFLQQPGMKVISSLPMGTREKIVLVEVDNQKLLLGVTPHNISSLHVFEKTELATPTEPAATDALADAEMEASESNAPSTEKWDFSRHLKKIIGEGQGER